MSWTKEPPVIPPAPTPGGRRRDEVTDELLRHIEGRGNVYSYFDFETIPDLQKRVVVTEPVQLFGPLVIEGAFTILFGAPKIGKSILLFQVAAGIASGKHYGMPCQAPPQPVLYIDVENKDTTIARRVGDHDVHPNLIRCKLKQSYTGNMRDDLGPMLAHAMEKHRAKVIVLDNLSYFEGDIRGDVHQETNKFLRPLNDLCQAHGATIIAGHHRPKGDEGPMTLKSISGSSEYARRCDAVVGMGKPDGDTQARYLVQLINRDDEPVHHGSNVAFGHLEEIEGLVQWTYTPAGNCSERALFKSDIGGQRVSDRVLELLLDDPDMSNDEVKDEVDCSPSMISHQRNAAKAVAFWKANEGATGVEVKRATGVDDRAVAKARKYLNLE